MHFDFEVYHLELLGRREDFELEVLDVFEFVKVYSDGELVYEEPANVERLELMPSLFLVLVVEHRQNLLVFGVFLPVYHDSQDFVGVAVHVCVADCEVGILV